MKNEIQRLSEVLRIKSIDKALFHAKFMNFAFCFSFYMSYDKNIDYSFNFLYPWWDKGISDETENDRTKVVCDWGLVM